MYLRNKCLYMQEQGWEVDLISAQKGPVLIPELKKYDLFIPELGFCVYLFPKKIRERIIKSILDRILYEKYDEIVFESSCLSECTWAEEVAEQCKARHLCFILQEYTPVSSEVEKEFFKFKYKRHELAGIVQKSLYSMFLPFWPIKMENSYFLTAHCNNVVEEIGSEITDSINTDCYDYIIGCLSRLDKPFVVPALTDFIKYVEKHLKKKYLLLLIGGAPEGTAFGKNLRRMFKGIENVELKITGFLYPVPAKLLEKCDVFITSAGSAWVCTRAGVPTISYDTNDLHPIGILGRTTKSSVMRNADEPVVELSLLLDDILERKIFKKDPPCHRFGKPDFCLHDKFLSEMSQKKEYYSFKNASLSLTERILSILLRVVGAENYYKLGEVKRNILNRKTSDR